MPRVLRSWAVARWCRPLCPRPSRSNWPADDVQLVDSRDMLAFGGGHIPGAISLGADKTEMSVYAGWVLDPEKPILLVLESDESLQHVVRMLVRTGFTKFAGYLTGGMPAWNNAGLPLQQLRQMHAREVASSDGSLQRLDVRLQSEFCRGHVPGAINCFVADLLHEQPDLDHDRPVVTYCGMGYRASLAASLLQRAGCDDVRNMPGSFKAWTTLGLPVQK